MFLLVPAHPRLFRTSSNGCSLPGILSVIIVYWLMQITCILVGQISQLICCCEFFRCYVLCVYRSRSFTETNHGFVEKDWAFNTRQCSGTYIRTYIHTHIHTYITYTPRICKVHEIQKSHYTPRCQLQLHPNKCVFSFCLKAGNVTSGCRSLGGWSFHNREERRPWSFCLGIGCVCACQKQHSDVIGTRAQWSTAEIWQLMTVMSEVCGCHAS